ncbi:ABC transporter ATP-binding protein [Gluconacetobacter sp. Hr-1-5]|uniref:ABC transporter ATP-binding protein n=1 Tax=Gluconacetobacter sp. Hr-1-5 TaxID=3395370 RepID=UPI003B522696
MTPHAVARWGSYRLLLSFMRPYAGSLLLVGIISLCATALGLAQPWLSKLMIDKALTGHDLSALIVIAGLMVVVAIAGHVLGILSAYRYAATSAAMLFDIRVALLSHLQTLSPRFYARFRLGDLMSRLNGDVGDVQRIAADTVLSVLSNLMMLAGCVTVMLSLDWRMFVISVVLIPFCVLSFLYFQRRLTALTRQMRERGADVGSMLVDSIMGMRVVTSLRARDHEIARFRGRNAAFVAVMLRMQVSSFLAGAIPGSLLMLATSGVVVYGGMQVLAGKMTIGTLVAFMTYQSRLFGPIQALMGLISGLSAARVSLARLLQLLETRPDVRQKETARAFGGLRNEIRMSGVVLRHDGRDILRGVDLAIPKGRVCAVLGVSGVGKSSLVDLIVRNLDPDEGCVTIDGIDLRDLDLDDLRRDIVLVDQAPHLFNDTIAANIAFALPEASQADIDRAVMLAGLDGLIARLPQGLQTEVGERGLALSVGERQRVALARVLLRRPGVLVLDEPTAALDSQTERLVIARLREALPDATMIVVTHRPAVAEMADLVIVMEDGRACVQTAATAGTV